MYVSKAREGLEGHFVIFRVDAITETAVTISYLFLRPTPALAPAPTPTPLVAGAPTPADVADFCAAVRLEFVAWDLPSAVGQTNYPGSIDVSYLVPANASIDSLFLVLRTTKSLEGGATLAVLTTFSPIIDGLAHTLNVPVNVPPASHYEDVFGITDPIELQLPPLMQVSFDLDGQSVFVSSSGACG